MDARRDDDEHKSDTETPLLEVVDLFCGCGGFSTGARGAGAAVVLAVDCNDDMLAIHTANHPGTTHLKLELGTEESTQELLRRIDPRVHLHASPPCTDFSQVNPNRDPEQGMEYIEWAIDLISELRPASWSIENVPPAQGYVLRYLEEKGVPYEFAGILRADLYGTCCIRRCFFVGGGWAKPMTTGVRIGPSSFLTDRRATHTYVNYTDYKKGALAKARPVSEPAQSFTSKNKPVLLECHDPEELKRTTKPHRRATANWEPMYPEGRLRRRLATPAEVGMIMGFPADYHWLRGRKSMAVIGAGNCVPPKLARAIVWEVIRRRQSQ